MSKSKKNQTQNKVKRKVNFRIILAIILAIIGIVLIFADPIRNFVLQWQVNNQTQAMLNISAEELEKNKNLDAEYDFDVIDDVSIQSVMDAATNRSKVPAIGMVSVPSVGINLTIAKGVSNLNMLVGAGTLTAEQKMGEGNYSLASHHLDSSFGENLLFTPLQNSKIGEKIYLTDMINIYEYTIYSNELVQPTRIDVIDEIPGKKIVTLITCGQRGTMRYVIQGELSNVTPMENADSTLKSVFGIESRTYK